MATDNAVIVIAQAETEHGDAVVVAPADGEHTTETLGQENLEHAESGMPQLDGSIFPNLIFWLIIAIGVLYLVLSRVALPRIGTVLTERSDAISNDIEQAALLKRRAEEAEAAYDAALAQAREEAHRIAAENKAQIDKELAALTAKANAEIAARAAELEKRIAEIGDSADLSVEEVARATAADIVAALMPQASADASDIDAAVSNRLKG